MNVIDGIAYANDKPKEITIVEIAPLKTGELLVTFSTGEKRCFNKDSLGEFVVFNELKDPAVFLDAKLAYGTIIWRDGDIDIAPEAVYERSVPYQE